MPARDPVASTSPVASTAPTRLARRTRCERPSSIAAPTITPRQSSRGRCSTAAPPMPVARRAVWRASIVRSPATGVTSSIVHVAHQRRSRRSRAGVANARAKAARAVTPAPASGHRRHDANVWIECSPATPTGMIRGSFVTRTPTTDIVSSAPHRPRTSSPCRDRSRRRIHATGAQASVTSAHSTRCAVRRDGCPVTPRRRSNRWMTSNSGTTSQPASPSTRNGAPVGAPLRE